MPVRSGTFKGWPLAAALPMALIPVVMAVVVWWSIQDTRRDHSKYRMVTTHSETNFLGWTIKSSSTREVPIDE